MKLLMGSFAEMKILEWIFYVTGLIIYDFRCHSLRGFLLMETLVYVDIYGGLLSRGGFFLRSFTLPRFFRGSFIFKRNSWWTVYRGEFIEIIYVLSHRWRRYILRCWYLWRLSSRGGFFLRYFTDVFMGSIYF